MMSTWRRWRMTSSPPVVRPWMELMPVAHGAEFEII